MQFDKTWTKSKYIYLINIVKEHPCIWDQNHLSFKKIRVKNAAWNRVAELLSTDAGDNIFHFYFENSQKEHEKKNVFFLFPLKCFFTGIKQKNVFRQKIKQNSN